MQNYSYISNPDELYIGNIISKGTLPSDEKYKVIGLPQYKSIITTDSTYVIVVDCKGNVKEINLNIGPWYKIT